MEPVDRVLTAMALPGRVEHEGRRRLPPGETASSGLHRLPQRRLPPAATTAPFEPNDVRRIDATIARATSFASADPAALLPQGASSQTLAAVRETCRFAHSGVLLFPTELGAALHYFSERDLDPLPVTPSVLVRRRLCERYGLAAEDCRVSITGLRPLDAGFRHHIVEVFLLPKTADAWSSAVADDERVFGFENHLAFDIARPDERLLEQLMTLLQAGTGLVWEGGGHNPHDGPRGSTVFYFVGGRSLRWELRCEGDVSAIVARHQVDATKVARAYAEWGSTATVDHD